MNSILTRLYGDYLMPSQLPAYEDLMRAAYKANYLQISVRTYHDMLNTGRKLPERMIVNRHDIDTDLRTTRKLFELEKKLGVKSSYYFRLSTLDIRLMREIEEYGSEASYHYEELATYAKRYKIKDAAMLRERLPEIRMDFISNFTRIEQQVGKKMRTVASHGDFANRKLKINNTEILADQELRQRCGIEAETYDRHLMDNADIYISDMPPPEFYRPCSPLEALGRHRRIYLLTHPRNFEANWKANTNENLFRVYEGLSW
jgi:hypothetical protein